MVQGRFGHSLGDLVLDFKIVSEPPKVRVVFLCLKVRKYTLTLPEGERWRGAHLDGPLGDTDFLSLSNGPCLCKVLTRLPNPSTKSLRGNVGRSFCSTPRKERSGKEVVVRLLYVTICRAGMTLFYGHSTQDSGPPN